MHVFLNGKIVPEEQAVVSVFDRGFLYGDGLFETLRISNGKPFCWKQHWERFENGARFLGIKPAFSENEMHGFAERLIANNEMPESLLRVTISRGVGLRGYSPKGAEGSTTVMSLHPAPENRCLRTAVPNSCRTLRPETFRRQERRTRNNR